MKVKKYTGENMQDVIFKVKSDLGPEAVIVNKRKFKKGGFFGFFGKEMFEVVAALEAKSDQAEPAARADNDQQGDDVVEISNYGRSAKKAGRTKIQKTASEDPENKNAIKEFISDLKTAADTAAEKEKAETENKKNNFREQLNEHQSQQEQKAEQQNKVQTLEKEKPKEKEDLNKKEKIKEQNFEKNQRKLTAAQKLQNKFQNKKNGGRNANENLNNSNQLYNYLLDQGVESRNVNLFLKGMDAYIESENDDLETQLKDYLAIYFADNTEIELDSDQKVVSFIGPTGVGKTTTMAKIAAHFAVENNKRVGLITADTYRIAAVEQLQTYSEIIDIPFAVCYSSSKLQEMIEGQFRNCDLILIDTPGSSWKDQQQLGRLKDFVNHDFVDEVHLLLSLNTKSSDLRNIVSKFSKLEPDKALLTKLDETTTYGDIINVKKNHNLPLSYLTCGQDVPEDLETANADQIYKYLFGDFYA
ncbi:MAG: flagellar biosynthesis protein FlhF [Halanaerobium sp.]